MADNIAASPVSKLNPWAGAMLYRWLRLKKAVAAQSVVDPPKEAVITLATAFEDLGMGPLDLVETVMRAEEEFSIDIPDSEIQGLRTVGDLFRAVNRIIEG